MLRATAAVLLLTPPGTPAGGFHWQRIITPPPGAAIQQACVVLDAATFANAAPALRDLRLFQDGAELAYIIEESFDERALNSGITPDDDRSEYEPVAAIPMQAFSGLASSGVQPTRLIATGSAARFRVDAHVPVERIRLDPVPTSKHTLALSASPVGSTSSGQPELASFPLNAGTAAWPFTLGANLQRAADVIVTDDAAAGKERVIFEMRKRSLCYQPRSANPLVLYLGGGQGMAAKTYGLANGFSTTSERPYATLGPLEPNPDQLAPSRRPTPRLLLAIAALTATLLITVVIAATLALKAARDKRERIT